MLRNDEYEIVAKDVLTKEMIIKREIKPGEQIDLSNYQYSIVIRGSIGVGAIVTAPYNLTVEGDICKNSIVSAHHVTAHNIGDKSSIKARGRITVATVGSEVTLEAHDNITTLYVCSNSTLVSHHGTVRTTSIGNYTTIKAFYQVFADDVGEYAKINAEKLDVHVGNISAYAEITALSDIYFINLKDEAKLTSKNGQLMKQGSCAGAYSPYIHPGAASAASAPTLQHQQSLAAASAVSISVSVKNASLSTLSIDVPLNLDFGKPSASTATFFAVEKNAGENTLKVESDANKVTYNIEKRADPSP